MLIRQCLSPAEAVFIGVDVLLVVSDLVDTRAKLS